MLSTILKCQDVQTYSKCVRLPPERGLGDKLRHAEVLEPPRLPGCESEDGRPSRSHTGKEPSSHLQRKCLYLLFKRRWKRQTSSKTTFWQKPCLLLFGNAPVAFTSIQRTWRPGRCSHYAHCQIVFFCFSLSFRVHMPAPQNGVNVLFR